MLSFIGNPNFALNNKNFEEKLENLDKKIEEKIEDIDTKIEELEKSSNDIALTTEKTLIDSKVGGLKINSIAGKSQQDQYSGGNLFDVYNRSGTDFSSTATVSSDGWVTDTYDNSSGTSLTYLNYYTRISDNLLTDTDYLIVTENESNVPVYVISNSGETDISQFTSTLKVTSNTIDFTVKTTRSDFSNSTKMLRTFVEVPAGTKVTVKFRISVLADATVTKDTFVYEPYVGGAPAPNPDYPQDINSVVIKQIKGVGKNLLKNIKSTSTIAGITYTVNDDDSVTVNGTATAQSTFIFTSSMKMPIDRYKFAYNYSSQKITTAADQYFNNKWEKVVGVNGAVFEVTEENADRDFQFYIRVASGNTVNNVTVYPFLRLADIEDDTYEPYQEKTITLSSLVSLCGIGDVKDAICKQNGVYGVLRHIQSHIFNGSEQWALDGTNPTYKLNNFAVTLSPTYIKNVINSGLCSHFSIDNNVIANSNREGIRFVGESSNCYIRVSMDRCNTLNSFKAWLSANNVTVDYQLATPVFTPLPETDQIALHQLETFDTITYISTDSKIEPIIEVEYGTSKVGAYAIKGLNDVEADKILVDTKINNVNTKVNEFDTKINNINTKVNKIDAKMDEIDTKFNNQIGDLSFSVNENGILEVTY